MKCLAIPWCQWLSENQNSHYNHCKLSSVNLVHTLHCLVLIERLLLAINIEATSMPARISTILPRMEPVCNQNIFQVTHWFLNNLANTFKTIFLLLLKLNTDPDILPFGLYCRLIDWYSQNNSECMGILFHGWKWVYIDFCCQIATDECFIFMKLKDISVMVLYSYTNDDVVILHTTMYKLCCLTVSLDSNWFYWVSSLENMCPFNQRWGVT